MQRPHRGLTIVATTFAAVTGKIRAGTNPALIMPCTKKAETTIPPTPAASLVNAPLVPAAVARCPDPAAESGTVSRKVGIGNSGRGIITSSSR